MNEPYDISVHDIEKLYSQLNEDAEAGGYHLNPDTEFTKDLVRSLLVNERRYGYPACPCRLASGKKDTDLDIICPCDYRDQDLAEFGACYCGLYITQEVIDERKKIQSIPERRPVEEERKKQGSPMKTGDLSSLPYPVWRCRVCGYLCARKIPPESCPVCKAGKERFEEFL